MLEKYASGSYDVPNINNLNTSAILRVHENGSNELEIVIWWGKLYIAKNISSTAREQLEEKTFREGVFSFNKMITAKEVFDIYYQYLISYISILINNNLIKKYPSQEELVKLVSDITNDLLQNLKEVIIDLE